MNINFFTKNYSNHSTELCSIAQKYDTDKCAIRRKGHSHPYSIFYNDLFANRRLEYLNIGEVGIMDGGSLLMWNEFSPNAPITGWDNDPFYLNKAVGMFGENDQINVDYMDIRNAETIEKSLSKNGPFDILIDDSTHFFKDQVNFLKIAVNHLNPRGTVVIEDVFLKNDHRNGQSHSAEDYQKAVMGGTDNSLLNGSFEECYLIHLDHENRRSYGWNNDGLLIFDKYLSPMLKDKKSG